MANIKFSGFTEVTSISGIQEIVGYNGTQNVRITPANFLSSLPGGPFLPLAGGAMTGNIVFNSGVRAQFGTGNNSEIFFTGSNFVASTFTGDFIISNYANDKDIIFKSDNGSGGVATYITIDGANVRTKFSKNTVHTDNIRANFGSGSDLQIYHDGTNSAINNLTGDLYIMNAADDKSIIFQNDDGSGGLETYFQLEGASGGPSPFTSFPDSSTLAFGTGHDMRLYHNGTGSYVDNYTGVLQFSNFADDSDIVFKSDDGSGGTTAYITLDGSTTNAYFTNPGNVGIGTSSPTTWKLTVDSEDVYAASFDTSNNTGLTINGNNATAAQLLGYSNSASTYNDLDIRSNSTAGSGIYIDGSASTVGIGTTSPGYKLSVDDNSVTNIPKTLLQFDASSIADNGGYNIDFRTSSNDLADRYVARIRGIRESSGGLSQLSFWTESGSALEQRMTINSTGNVGIGTTSPGNRLQVTGGSVGIDSEFMIRDNKNNTIFQQSASTSATNRTLTIANATYGETVIPNGNVGIGTTSPALQSGGTGLHINATTSSELKFTNDNTGSGAADGTALVSNSNDFLINNRESGDINFGTSNSERMTITSGGVVGVGTDGLFSFGSGSESGTFIQQSSYMGISIASGQTAAFILRRLEDGTLQRFYNLNTVVGSISVAGSATGYNTSSDYRLKEDLKDFDGLDKVSKIPVYDFKWKVDDSRSYGVMAHELEEVLPNAVSGKKDGEEMQGVDYSKIVPLLVKSIQELSAKVTALENS